MKCFKRMVAGFLSAVMLLLCLSTYAAVGMVTTDTSIPGWTTTISNVDGECYVDGAEFYTGKGSMRIINKTEGGSRKFIEPLTRITGLKSGKTYVLEFDAKIQGAEGNPQVAFDNATRYKLAPISKSYDWTHFKYEYNVSKTTLEVSFIVEKGPTESLWVDNICLYDKTDKNKTNLISNGTFETGMIIKNVNFNQDETNRDIYIYRHDIKVDGDFSDWRNIKPTEITRVQRWKTTEEKPLIKGNIRFAYDDSYLYIAVESEDNVHYQTGTTNYWEDDGIQFALANEGEDRGTEYGVTYSSEKDVTQTFGTDMITATTQEGTKTFYEIAFPWNAKFPGGRPKSFLFNGLVNNNDGDGREYCIEMAPGISSGKFTTQYKKMLCMTSIGDIGYIADIPSEYEVGVQQSGRFLIFNNSNSVKNVAIHCGELNIDRNVKLAAAEVKTIDFNFAVSSYDGTEIGFDVSCGDEKAAVKEKLSCKYGEKDFIYLCNKLSGYCNELKKLLLECDKKEIPTDYEMLNYSVIKKWMSYMKDESEHNDYSRISRYNNILTELYNEAKENLMAYLSGKKEAMRVPRYTTSEKKLDGTTVTARTFDGFCEEERPVFFVGYGHWETPREELPFFSSIGSSLIQGQGVSMLSKAEDGYVLPENATEIEKRAFENGWKVDYTNLNKMKEDLKRAAKYNVIVSINLNTSLPDFVSSLDPATLEGSGNFLRYNVDHPLTREYIEVYARLIASTLKDCEALFDLSITNEPRVFLENSAYFSAKWIVYLTERYKTVEKLNATYGSEYRSIDEIAMPKTFERTPLYYDFMKFADGYFTDYHNWYAGVIKDEAPNIRVSAKVMDYIDYYYSEDIGRSTYEGLSNLDLNGCDAFGYYDWLQHPLQLKMAWYDYATSVKDAPVWNTEDHIIRDLQSVDYNEIIKYHTSADIWNGAVHGRGGSAIWIWDKRDASMPWGAASGYIEKFQNSNFVLRPAEVAAIGKTSLDLNRLSKEVTAIQKTAPEVGLLYSRTSLLYDDSMKVIQKAYEGIIYNGQKVGFVTDSRPSDMHKYKYLVIPAAKSIPTETAEEIVEFTKNGGKLLIINEKSLTRNEYNRELDAEIVNKLYQGAVVIDGENIEAEITKQFKAADMDTVMLIDTETGKKVNGTEWSWAAYNGNIIVNILNYDYGKNKSVKLVYNGKDVKDFKELRSAKTYENTISLGGYEPVLVEFKN